MTNNLSGGYDIAEDILSVVHRCASWTSWSSMMKFMIVVTDAPAHGFVCVGSLNNADTFPQVHPNGYTVASTVDVLIHNGIDLALCSYNPQATGRTEEALAKQYVKHDDNIHQREIIRIPLILTHQEDVSPALGDRSQHIIFVLDNSGSMAIHWAGVENAFRQFCEQRLNCQCSSDLASVVQFDCQAVVAFRQEGICTEARSLDFRGGGTYYTPAAQETEKLVLETPGHCFGMYLA